MNVPFVISDADVVDVDDAEIELLANEVLDDMSFLDDDSDADSENIEGVRSTPSTFLLPTSPSPSPPLITLWPYVHGSATTTEWWRPLPSGGRVSRVVPPLPAYPLTAAAMRRLRHMR